MPFLSSRIPRKIFVSSLFIRRFLFYLPPITFSFSRIIKRRTKGERTSEKKGKDLRLLRHTEEDETRHLRFIVDDWPSAVRIRNRWNDHRRIRTVPLFLTPSPPLLPSLLSLASLFSRTDSEIRRCPYNYDGRGGNMKLRPSRLFLWFEIPLLPRGMKKFLLLVLLFFFFFQIQTCLIFYHLILIGSIQII